MNEYKLLTCPLQELSERLSSEQCKGLVRAIRCDVTKEEDILAVFSTIQKEFGGVDVCINNAGIYFTTSTLVDGETAAYRNMIDVNKYECIITGKLQKS